MVADVLLMTAVRDTWNIPSLGQCPGRPSGDTGRGSCSGGAMRLEGGPCGAAGRPEWSQESVSRVVVERAVDDGRAGHMKNTVAEPGSWKAVDGQRAVPRLIVCR